LFRERGSHFDQTVIRLGLFAAIAPEDAHCWSGFAEAIVEVVDAPFGKRIFPVHIDPTRTEPRWPSQLLTASGRRCFIGFAFDELLTSVKR